MIRPHNRCRFCSLRHYPMCSDGARWEMGPLLDRMPDDASPLVVFSVSAAKFADWCDRGIDTFHADRLAMRLGFHPAQVWGWAWVDAGLSVVDRQFLDGGWRCGWLHGEGKATEVRAA